MKPEDAVRREGLARCVQRLVAERFDLEVEQLSSGSVRREVVIPRQIAIFLVKQVSDASLPEIGSYFGGKHHTTVMHAIAKIEEQRKADATLQRLLVDLLAAVRQSSLEVSENNG